MKGAAAVFIFLAVLSLIYARSDVDSHETKDVAEDRRVLHLLHRLLTRTNSGPNVNAPTYRKRTCYFNGGMSHSCDYKELMGAVDEANYWSSDQTPGRRKRRASNYAETDSNASETVIEHIIKAKGQRLSNTETEQR